MKISSRTGRTVDIKLQQYKNITEVECLDKEGTLQGLLSDEKRLLWKGDNLYTEDLGWYRVNMIKRIGPNNYRSTCMERTDTSMLLFPLFGGNQVEMCYSDYFMNAFLYHEEHGIQEGIVWVLMKKPLKPETRYTKAIDKLRSSKRCIKEETLTSEFTLFTMKLPEKSIKDYTMVSLSKFSKMSDKAKNDIFTFHNILGQSDHQLKSQLTKSPIYKAYLEKKIGESIHFDAELRSVIDEDRETFKMSYITEDIR